MGKIKDPQLRLWNELEKSRKDMGELYFNAAVAAYVLKHEEVLNEIATSDRHPYMKRVADTLEKEYKALYDKN